MNTTIFLALLYLACAVLTCVGCYFYCLLTS
jgi:hypothetical protein